MIFLNEKNKSILQKIVIITALSAAFCLAVFVNGNSFNLRHILLITCVLIYILRLGVTLFLFIQRRLVWLEALTISVVMSIILSVIIYTGKNNPMLFSIIYIHAILLYISGSFINTYSEYLRYIWKRNPKNKGHIYKYGLFKYSMHINYFGDVLLFSGLSILTGRYWTLIIPIGMLLNFMIFIIPGLDNYLSQKYGDEFTEYSQTTKKIIPYIY